MPDAFRQWWKKLGELLGEEVLDDPQPLVFTASDGAIAVVLNKWWSDKPASLTPEKMVRERISSEFMAWSYTLLHAEWGGEDRAVHLVAGLLDKIGNLPGRPADILRPRNFQLRDPGAPHGQGD